MNTIFRKFSKLFYFFKNLFKDFRYLKNEQINNFKSLSLDYLLAEKKLKSILKDNADISYNMKSEHLVLFSAFHSAGHGWARGVETPVTVPSVKKSKVL